MFVINGSNVLSTGDHPELGWPALAQMLAEVGVARANAPRFVWKFWDSMPMAHSSAGIVDCVGSPREATNPPHKLKVGPHRNVMVSNSTHDPATPLANALSVWLPIPEARTPDRRRRWASEPALVQVRLRGRCALPRRSGIAILDDTVRQMSSHFVFYVAFKSLDQRLVHTGLRFSANALGPSR